MALHRRTQEFRFPRIRGIGLDEEPITLAQKQIANVQRNRNAMLRMERLLAVAMRVAVFDVVVDERCLVEAFHRDRHPLHVPVRRTQTLG